MEQMLADDDISMDEDADREERDEFGRSSLVEIQRNNLEETSQSEQTLPMTPKMK